MVELRPQLVAFRPGGRVDRLSRRHPTCHGLRHHRRATAEKALQLAAEHGWMLISMQDDLKEVF